MYDSGMSIDKDCEACTCSFEFGLRMYAHDLSDFNPGDSFGPGGFFQDDWFIWLRDSTVVGTDFTIYAYWYRTDSKAIDYSEQ